MKLFIIITICFIFYGCSPEVANIRNSYQSADPSLDTLSPDLKFIKVHLEDGRLAVIKNWSIDKDSEIISGKGRLYDHNRNLIDTKTSEFSFNFEDCILIETNEYQGQNLVSGSLMVLTTALSGVSVPCLFDPKACFGSCPTYYSFEGDSLVIQAEGFSSSITRSMEATDIDRLSNPGYSDELRLELKNEALETHYIRTSEILAVPTPSRTSIHHNKKGFFVTSDLSPPIATSAEYPNLLELVREKDRNEFLPPADSKDLSTQISIEFTFESKEAATSGIIITQRQSFMTTYLFYQSMAYMGTKAGELMAAYERSSDFVKRAQKSMYDVLGGVEVSVLINGKWKRVGNIEEQGPIVTDTHLIPIELNGKFEKVRLTMTKGLWRIDQVAVCDILKEVRPTVIQASKLLNQGKDEGELLELLNNSEKQLVNNPGESYTLVFDLPEHDNNLTFFLKSKGYYVEWMREEWLAEEDMKMVMMLLKNPEKWLKVMAPKYKQVESEMEELFWASKFGNG